MRFTDAARPTAAVPPPVTEPANEAIVRPAPALASRDRLWSLPVALTVLPEMLTSSLPLMLLAAKDPPTPAVPPPAASIPMLQISPSSADSRLASPLRLTVLSVSFAARSASIRLTATPAPTPAVPPPAARLKASDQMLAPRLGWLAEMVRLRAVISAELSSAVVVSAIRL